MAKVLCAGGRLDSVTVTGVVTESTTATYRESAYSDCALTIADYPNSTVRMTFRGTDNLPVDVVTGETLYVHAMVYVYASTGYNILTLEDSSGQIWAALRKDGTGASFHYLSTAPSTFTQVGSSFLMPSQVLYEIDIKLTLGSPHQVEVSLNRVLAVSGSFTQAGLTALRSFRAYGGQGGNTSAISQMMATEGISTVGGKVKTLRPTAAGSNSAWTGAYTNVNETVDNNTTVDSTTTAGNMQSYAMGDVTVPAGYVVKSLFHAMYVKNDGAAPQNVRSLVRSGGADYVGSSNLPGVGTSFTPQVQRWDVDPATGTTWTQAGVNAVEAGYRSET